MNLGKNIAGLLKLSQTFWRSVGQRIVQEIRKDTSQGLFQNDAQNLRYMSKQYMKYKANEMRRFTKGEGKVWSDKEGFAFGRTYFQNKKAKKWKIVRGEHGGTRKMLVHQGRRISGYEAGGIDSTNTSFVDMTLTGKLGKGLKVKEPIDNGRGIWVGYDPKDAGKILGNERYGRYVRGLNTKNQQIVKQMLLEEYAKKKKGLLSEVININL